MTPNIRHSLICNPLKRIALRASYECLRRRLSRGSVVSEVMATGGSGR
jgi:hypothetical protein